MCVRRALVVVALLFVSGACRMAAPEQAIQELGQATRSQLLANGRLRAALGVATASLDVVLNTTPGALPSKVKLSAPSSSGGFPGGTEGVVAIVLSANVSDLLGRQEAANPFSSIALSVPGGATATGRYDSELMGAYACTTGPSSKSIKGTIKLKGTTSQATGVGAVFGLARIPLAALGITPSQFIDLCGEIAGLIPGLLPAHALRDRLEATH